MGGCSGGNGGGTDPGSHLCGAVRHVTITQYNSLAVYLLQCAHCPVLGTPGESMYYLTH